MTAWARLSVGYWHDPKVLAVSPAAELLYVRGIAYSVDQLSDGLIVRGALGYIAAKLDDPDAAASELLAAGLWDRAGRADYRYPRDAWARWQTLRADVDAKVEKDRDRKRRWRGRGTDASATPSRRDGPRGTDASRADSTKSASPGPAATRTRRGTDAPATRVSRITEAEAEAEAEAERGEMNLSSPAGARRPERELSEPQPLDLAAWETYTDEAGNLFVRQPSPNGQADELDP